MRKWPYLLVFPVVLLLAGCSDDDSPAAPQTSPVLSLVEGKVETWTSSKEYYLALSVENLPIETAEINPDGSFSMIMHAPPSPMLRNFTDVYYDNTIHISDEDAKFAPAKMYIMRGYNQAGIIFQGDKQESGNDPLAGEGSYAVEYWYFDMDVTITGWYSKYVFPLTNTNEYDLKCYKGWNKIFKRVYSESITERVYHYETTPSAETKYYALLY